MRARFDPAQRWMPIPKATYDKAIAERPKEITEIRAVFKDVDAFLTPTHPIVAPLQTVDAEGSERVRQFTVPVSFTGLPAVSVPCGFSPIGLPNTGSLDFPWPGVDRDADPSFAEALAVRRDRAARFAKYLADLEPADLSRSHEVLENGNAPVQACLHVVFEEEAAHHGYATRDLDALERA